MTVVAIAEHQRQSETIKFLQQSHHGAMAELEMTRRDLNNMRMENHSLRGELSAMSQNQGASTHNAPPADMFSRGPQRPELPPLRSLSGGNLNGGPDSMTGVQYDQPRTNGQRVPDGRY